MLLHGVGDTLAAWTPVRELLAAEHEVVALDLPGFGRSRMLGEAPTPAALARAVAAFMGPDPFHVAGNSLGGGIALERGRRGGAGSVACQPGLRAVVWFMWAAAGAGTRSGGARTKLMSARRRATPA